MSYLQARGRLQCVSHCVSFQAAASQGNDSRNDRPAAPVAAATARQPAALGPSPTGSTIDGQG